MTNLEVNKLCIRVHIHEKWLADCLKFMMRLDGYLTALILDFVRADEVLKCPLLLLALTLKTKKLYLQSSLWIVCEAAVWLDPI